MKKLVHMANKKELAPGQIFRHPEHHEVILVCQSPGVYRAVSSVCTHQNWPLYDSYICENRIVCALHGSEFDLETGKCVTPPAADALKTYSIVEMGDELYVELNQDERVTSEPRHRLGRRKA
jgi:3-phenylpropionate/trans-cinnamate dioxygenase ferredoxin subunit